MSISHEDAEKMRQILAEHDRAEPPRTFDLAKPPVEPYVYREFPRFVFGPEGKTRVVHDAAELKRAAASGYEPNPPAPPQELAESRDDGEPAGELVEDGEAEPEEPVEAKKRSHAARR